VTPVVLALPGNAALAARLAGRLEAALGRLTVRAFPDGESYVRIESEVAGRDVVLACTLDRPDAKLVPLLLLAARPAGVVTCDTIHHPSNAIEVGDLLAEVSGR
jgi:ribose-phosphate pyrophosphokinase